jgi:hypothetical protein
MPQPSVGPEEDGRVVTADGQGLRWPYIVASSTITWRGTRIARSSAGLALWRLEPPSRMATWVQNVQYNGVVDEHAKIFAYDCRRGVFRIALRAPGPRSVRLLLNEGAFRRFELETGDTIALTVPASPSPGHRLCTFDLLTNAPVETTRFAFEPARS